MNRPHVLRTRAFLVGALGRVLLGFAIVTVGSTAAHSTTFVSTSPWSFNATVIEACSCPMFCQCYFSTSPAPHGSGEHFCRFNNAFNVNRGRFGNVQLNGAKFWLAGDLGGDFSKGQMDWAVLTFDPSVTSEQRKGILAILPHLYPATWNSFKVAPDAPIEWHAAKDLSQAEARLAGGKAAEVVLRRNPGMTKKPVAVTNLKYWGAPRNGGFLLMPTQLEAYRVGDKPFEFKGTNGFMITVDMSSRDVK